MKKIILLIVAIMAMSLSEGLNAMNSLDQREIVCRRYPEKPISRSLGTTVSVFQSKDYIIVRGDEACQQASITIINSDGIEVKNQVVMVSPDEDTTIYIGDLGSGSYDLTIELEDYILYGSFEVR